MDFGGDGFYATPFPGADRQASDGTLDLAGFPQQAQIHRVVHAHAAGTLDQRLDDHRTDTVAVLGQTVFHVLEHLATVVFPAVPGFPFETIG